MSKRFAVKTSGKVKKRKAGQDHFNSRENGKTKRNKRRDVTVSKTVRRGLQTLMPYHKVK